MLYQPSFLGIKGFGIHKYNVETIMRCNIRVRKGLYSSIVLSGGNSTECSLHMQKELIALVLSAMNIDIFAPPDWQFSPWIGGSMLAFLPDLR